MITQQEIRKLHKLQQAKSLNRKQASAAESECDRFHEELLERALKREPREEGSLKLLISPLKYFGLNYKAVLLRFIDVVKLKKIEDEEAWHTKNVLSVEENVDAKSIPEVQVEARIRTGIGNQRGSGKDKDVSGKAPRVRIRSKPR